MATVPNFTKPIGMETADVRLARMQAEQAQRQVDRQNARAGTAMQGTYIAPQSSTQFVANRAAGQNPASPGYAVGQINQPLINAISDGGQYATAVRPVDQYFPMGGAQRPAQQSAPQQSYSPPQQANLARPPTPDTNAITAGSSAMIDALRQKPARFEGFGMGTNAQLPQVKSNIPVQNLTQGKMPNGLFSTR